MVHTRVWLCLTCLFCFQDHWLAEPLGVKLCLDGLLATPGQHPEDVTGSTQRMSQGDLSGWSCFTPFSGKEKHR